MGPPKTETKQKSWSEVNKIRKEEKRKWKEQGLLKKIKKRKQEEIAQTESNKKCVEATVNTGLPKTQLSTVSVAVPGSILENAQSPELRTYLCGQIARAACIFQIDEIVVFDDYGDEVNVKKATLEDSYGLKTARECCIQLGRILQYLECPQYLRKQFFPIHNHLKFCGILNPLNAPHHLEKKDTFEYREGVVLNRTLKPGKGSIINVGLTKEVHVDKLLTPGLRCTVKLLPESEKFKKLKGCVVSPSEPRLETGVYWGYRIRLANSLSKVFSQCPHRKGYDLTIGTSDKGSSVDDFQCPTYEHLLIVFGGLHGLEFALENDTVLSVDDPQLLFDHYLNTLPSQGSRTIRTEEAILVSLSALRSKLKPANIPKMFSNNTIQFEENVSVNNDMDRF